MKRIIAMLSVLLAIALLFAGAACAEEIAIEEEAAAIEEAFALEAEEEPEEEMEVEAAVSEEALPPEEALEAVEAVEAEAEPEAVSVEESLEEALLPASGVWGTCPWEISADGVLTIHAGTGEDTNGFSPWKSYTDEITAVVAREPIRLPADSSGLFSVLYRATEMDLSGLDTSGTTSMIDFFVACRSVRKLDVSGFSTGNVSHFASMFQYCESLTELDLSSFDTRNAVNMWQMFYGCKSLTRLNVTSFDTRNVNSMGGMFRGCSSLQTIDLHSFNTSKVTDLYRKSVGFMFADCTSLRELDLSSFDCRLTYRLYSAETSMSGPQIEIIDSCPSLRTIKVGEYSNYIPMPRPHVRAKSDNKIYDSYDIYLRTFADTYTAIVDVGAVNSIEAMPMETNAAYISWSTSWHANGYQLWRSDDGGASFKWIKNCTATYVMNYSLTSGKEYFFKVRPYYEWPDGSRDYGSFSDSCSMNTLKKITNLTGRGKDTNCAFLQWDPVPGCTGYQLFRAIEGTGGVYTWVKNCTTTEVANYALTPGTAYYYKVRAYIERPNKLRAYGQFSSPVRVAILPQGSIISLIGSPTTGKVHLTWKSIPGVTGYQLFTGPTGGSAPNWACNTTLPLSDVTQRVTQGTARSFRVRGYIQYEDGTRYYGQFSDVVNTIQSTGIALSADGEILENYGEVFVDNGGTLRLTPVFTPANTTLQTAAWSSTNETVATVNSKGVVTGLRPGKTYIKATPQDGGRSAVYCLVTVRPVYRALLIGNGMYTKASGSNPLDPICELDAAHLTSALSRRHGENNADWKITVQNELDGPEILTWIGNVFGSAREGDVNLFFYSGHGLAVMNDAGQILVRDPRTGSLCGVQGGNVTPAELVNRMNQCPGTFICLFDSCCSGAYIAQNGAALPDGSIDDPGADVFLSSLVGAFAEGDPGVTIPLAPYVENGEIAVPEPGYGEMQTAKYYVLAAAGAFQDSRVQDIDGSYFTNGLVYLAIGGAEQLVGDANRDGKLSLNEAYDAVEDYVKLCNTSQRTQIYPFASSYPILYQ